MHEGRNLSVTPIQTREQLSSYVGLVFEFLKICADIASLMSISLASAKKKVEIQITNQACKTIDEKRKVAKSVYDNCKKESKSDLNLQHYF